jgi:hypothetical protein
LSRLKNPPQSPFTKGGRRKNPCKKCSTGLQTR